jgi:uncharacterized protein YcbX
VPAPVDSHRSRPNIVIAGVPSRDKLDWRGRIRIGGVASEVQKPMGRCAAIMANPDTGERDERLLRVLTTEFDRAEPTLGIPPLPAAGGGAVRAGDEVVLEG